MTNGPTLGDWSRKEKVKKTMKKQRQKEIDKSCEREGFLAADQD